MKRPITIAVLAIGGQGGGVLVDWIVALAERESWRAQSTSVPGVAQRTGATIYYVELIETEGGQTPVFSAMAAPGDVDIVIAAEWMEAGRAIQRGLVTPDRTTLIASTHRAFAVSEKEAPGNGMADSGAVTDAARAASQRFVAFDMAALAEQAGSVVSSVLFGALCGTGALPFPRAAFEATITEAGVGVQGSLRGFALGFDGPPPIVAPVSVVADALAPVGHPPYDALLARAATFAAAAHDMLAEGLRHVVAFQDVAYGAAYLDAVALVAQSGTVPWRVKPGDDAAATLTESAAKYIARAMAYDDVIRVAALKTQPARAPRIQKEMAGQVLAVTEFMHPRMEELLGLLSPRLGMAIERRPRLVGLLDRVFCGPKRIRTDTIFGFLILYIIAGLRGWRRKTLRHARESVRIDGWLTAVRIAAAGDPALAVELLANQRLIKGYSDTHARGLDKFGRVMTAADRLRGRPDAAAWVRRLREAALKDEQGLALDAALRTVDTFLDEKDGRMTSRYRDNPQALSALVREAEVHRDVYIDPEIFTLEMERLFANTWVYVGHDSQVPNAGDYFGTTIGAQPVLMVRHEDGAVHVLYNRCPHKGTRITTETCGNTGRFFRCPYHAWSFRTDGSPAALPLPTGYENTPFADSQAAQGLTPVCHIHNYRGFVFARMSVDGPDFATFFGESLSSIDNMVDRSPVGRLEVAGGVLRYMHNCNWKMLVENQTDTCHPMVAHMSSAGTAIELWKRAGEQNPKPMAVEIYAPFMAPYEFYEKMGIRTWDNGHGHTGVSHSIHSNYSAVPGYFEQMVAAYGEARAKAILDESRHNTIYFPNLMVKGPIQLLRLFKPLGPDRTLVESWTFRLVDAPDFLLERTLVYNRLINAPTSVVGHDDLEMYERAQEGLHANGNPWVNLQRLYQPGETALAVDNGTTERQMRNQFRAWARYMAAGA